MRLFTGSWVVPVSSPPLPGGRVAVDGGRIAWVGRDGDPGQPDGPLTDLGDGVLLPGLVNAHTHLELSHLAGKLERGQGFVRWVEALVKARMAAGEEEVRAGLRRGIRQAESTGTVAVGDISNAMAHLDLLEHSALRAVVFYELLGWDPARAPVLLEAAARVTALAGDRTLRTRVKAAAHAPHSVSPALLEGLVEQGGPAAIHLAESPTETRFLGEGDPEWSEFLRSRGMDVAFTPPGQSPVRYLEGAGALHPGLVAAHCIHADAADRALLARRGVHAVICPRSNAALGSGTADVPALLAAGVKLALGTDSLASVESLDLLEDAAHLQRTFPALDPAAIVRMATLGGAEALGFAGLGALAPGREALLAWAAAESGLRDPVAFLTSGAAHARPVPQAA
jgi:aminodeoxyfutalosine deaminase